MNPNQQQLTPEEIEAALAAEQAAPQEEAAPAPESAPAEEMPAEEAPAEEVPAEEVPAEEAPADEVPMDPAAQMPPMPEAPVEEAMPAEGGLVEHEAIQPPVEAIDAMRDGSPLVNPEDPLGDDPAFGPSGLASPIMPPLPSAMPPMVPAEANGARVQPQDDPTTYDQPRVSTGVTLQGEGALNDVPERMWTEDQYGNLISDVAQPGVLGVGAEGSSAAAGGMAPEMEEKIAKYNRPAVDDDAWFERVIDQHRREQAAAAYEPSYYAEDRVNGVNEDGSTRLGTELRYNPGAHARTAAGRREAEAYAQQQLSKIYGSPLESALLRRQMAVDHAEDARGGAIAGRFTLGGLAGAGLGAVGGAALGVHPGMTAVAGGALGAGLGAWRGSHVSKDWVPGTEEEYGRLVAEARALAERAQAQ